MVVDPQGKALQWHTWNSNSISAAQKREREEWEISCYSHQEKDLKKQDISFLHSSGQNENKLHSLVCKF